MLVTSGATTTKTCVSSTSTAASNTATNKVAGTVHSMLRILNSRLGSEGNVKDSKDVAFITELMREAVKLVDRCMLLNVLLATTSSAILSTMLDSGGWTVLHNWLMHSRASDSRAFLMELLKLYQQLPVTVELLRQNSCAKDIKQLSKCPDTAVAGLAKSIITHWMDKVKEKGSGGSSSSGTAVSESTKRSDKSSSRADNAQNKSSSKLSSTSKSESSSRSSSTLKDSLNVRDSADDTDPSRVKTLCDSPDHISAKLNQHILSADHSAVTSNVASSVASDDSNSSNNTESAPLRTAS